MLYFLDSACPVQRFFQEQGELVAHCHRRLSSGSGRTSAGYMWHHAGILHFAHSHGKFLTATILTCCPLRSFWRWGVLLKGTTLEGMREGKTQLLHFQHRDFLGYSVDWNTVQTAGVWRVTQTQKKTKRVNYFLRKRKKQQQNAAVQETANYCWSLAMWAQFVKWTISP